LLEAGRSSSGRVVSIACGHTIARQFQQVRADRVKPVVLGDPLVGFDLSE
jgi:hypothetical protein